MFKKLVTTAILICVSTFSVASSAYYVQESSTFRENGGSIFGKFYVESVSVFSDPAKDSFAVIKLTKHQSDEASEYAVYLHNLSDATTKSLLSTFQNIRASDRHISLLRNDTQSSFVSQGSWHDITKVFHVYPGDKVELWAAE